jgi:uncharacterized protein YceH (UPF0502 family)
VLSAGERRVLGALVEKAKTTPDAYPMSLNSLVTACNQKTNRDPISSYADVEIEQFLTSAQRKGLVLKTITGTGRVTRWRHELYSAWHVDKVELAVLAELLLRGPQTEGELRSRASRMEPIDELEALRTVLRGLAQRGFVVYLTPEGRRGTIVAHGLYEPEELVKLKAGTTFHDEPDASPRHAPAQSAFEESALHVLQQDMAALKASLAEMHAQLMVLAARVKRLEEPTGSVN